MSFAAVRFVECLVGGNEMGLQLKLQDRSTEFDEKDAWSDDLLRNRDEASLKLYAIISNQELPFTICLNGAWGSGKTYFLTRFVANYNRREPVGKAIYFNAWQDDYLDDPLVAIISQLRNVVKDKEGSTYEQVKKAAIPFLARTGLTLTKQVVKKVSGIDLAELSVEDLETQSEILFKQYEGLSASRDTLIKVIGKLADETWKETQKPLLFVVDELDRCRPTFAIELLERIKHLFCVPHLVFLIGVDVCQLENSIRSVYGEINSHDYLHRFFDVELRLPESDKMGFVYALWNEHGLESILQKCGVDTSSQRTMLDEFSHLIKYRHVTLRQIEKCVRAYALLALSQMNGSCRWAFLAAIAVVLKVTAPEEYHKFIAMDYSLGSLIDMLYPGLVFKDADSDSGVFSMIQHLSKITYHMNEQSSGHKKFVAIKQTMSQDCEIRFDAEIMPKAFEDCSSVELKGFYSYVVQDERAFSLCEYRGVPKILEQMDKGLQFIGGL